MEGLQPMNEVLLSWRRCMEKEISYKASAPVGTLKDGILKGDVDTGVLRTIFKECAKEVNISITNKNPFLLVSKEGVLLKMFNGKDIKKNIGIMEDTVFTEECCGTNAVALSMLLKRPIYMCSNYQYCDFLRRYDIYSVPLYQNNFILGYLVVIISETQIIRELITISNLLGNRINYEYVDRLRKTSASTNSDIKLSRKQQRILTLIAKGMTDKAIAVETGLSLATIRYHKKNIFQKLNANCSLQAVVQALKFHLIFLDEI